jgi:hypothetical protein
MPFTLNAQNAQKTSTLNAGAVIHHELCLSAKNNEK